MNLQASYQVKNYIQVIQARQQINKHIQHKMASETSTGL